MNLRLPNLGDEEGALEVFRRIYASNTGLPPSQYPVQ